MKNQETIMHIKSDIVTLKQNIEVRKEWLNFFEVDDDDRKLLNKIDTKTISRLEKTVRKLEKEDRKTWREALIIAHGGIRAWWLEDWPWVMLSCGSLIGLIILFLLLKGAR
jgi:hypothetical protein